MTPIKTLLAASCASLSRSPEVEILERLHRNLSNVTFRDGTQAGTSVSVLGDGIALAFYQNPCHCGCFCSFGRGVAIPNHIGCFKFLGSMPLQLNTTFLQASLVSKCHNILLDRWTDNSELLPIPTNSGRLPNQN